MKKSRTQIVSPKIRLLFLHKYWCPPKLWNLFSSKICWFFSKFVFPYIFEISEKNPTFLLKSLISWKFWLFFRKSVSLFKFITLSSQNWHFPQNLDFFSLRILAKCHDIVLKLTSHQNSDLFPFKNSDSFHSTFRPFFVSFLPVQITVFLA